jgi:spore coat protein H
LRGVAGGISGPRDILYGISGHGDITDHLERMEGKGPLDWADLRPLALAVQEKDPETRWQKMQQHLDVDRFLSFMGLEMMLGHWDGYCCARHNFRVYHEPETDRVVFIPYDNDQILADPNFSIVGCGAGLVAQAMLNSPAARRLYLERVGQLSTNLFRVEALTNRVDELVVVARLRPQLEAYDANLAAQFAHNAQVLRTRTVNRSAGLLKQMPPPR